MDRFSTLQHDFSLPNDHINSNGSKFTCEPCLPNLVKSPTTTFRQITNSSGSSYSPALNQSNAYRRSDSLPSANHLSHLKFSSNQKTTGEENPAFSADVPSCTVRMLLDEKRRRIESSRCVDVAQKIKIIGDTSKEAFFKLQDKAVNVDTAVSTPPATKRLSLTAKMRERQALERSSPGADCPSTLPSATGVDRPFLSPNFDVDDRGHAAATNGTPKFSVAERPPIGDRSTSNFSGDGRPFAAFVRTNDGADRPTMALTRRPSSTANIDADAAGDFLTINESLRELKEQMHRLSVDHEKLQAKIEQKNISNDSTAPEGNFIKNAPPATNNRPTTPAHSSFHLHTAEEPPSRLDPSLELCKNLSSWGMTYRSNGRMPRKTWDSAGRNPANSQSSAILDSSQGDTFVISEPSPIVKGGFQLFGNNREIRQQSAVKNITYTSSPNSKRPISSPAFTTEMSQVEMNLNLSAGMNSSGSFVKPLNRTAEFSGFSSSFSPSFVQPPCDATFNLVDKMDGKSAPIGYILEEDQADVKENSLDDRKNKFIALALKRKAEQETRRLKVEQENLRKQEKLAKKLGEEEQKKKEKEMRRCKAFEEYQRRKVERQNNEFSSRSNLSQLAANPSSGRLNACGDSSTAAPLSVTTSVAAPASRYVRVRSQPAMARATRASRPASQYVTSSNELPCGGVVFKSTGRGSADNLDWISVKSQNSDGASGSGCSTEPVLKMFVKPTQKSNRNLIFNAIRDRVLIGAANSDKKNKVLEELARSDGKHFLILFRDQKFQFRAVYSWDQASDNVHKLFGSGPKMCHESSMHILFKYDSGAKLFNEIPARHLSASVDAFTIKDEYWQEKRMPYGRSSTMTLR